MKWIFIGLMMIVLPAQAAQQYTESSCIFLKQQTGPASLETF
jgi:hypothetical protein